MPRRSQEDRSRTTRAALEQAGRRLFGERGYAGVSAEEIVASAGVTRGALHHHYGDKRGLFLAVLEQLETDNAAEITHAIAQLPDPGDLLTAMAVALRTFLDQCRREETVRIAMSDALTVLGWQGWRDLERHYGLGLITDMLNRATEAGLVTPAPTDVLAQLILSAVTEAGMIIAHAEDPESAQQQAEQSMLLLISGILKSPPS